MSTAASVYLHVPWCLSRCPYCDFNTYAARSWPEKDYTDALLDELAWYRERPPFDQVSLATVFFGGGTPSLFAARSIGRLVDRLVGGFPVAGEIEVTLEANPGTVDRQHLAALRTAGVNRLSIGVQSFQPRLLEVLGRRHSVDESLRALDAARATGFDNLSLDLMYAIPTETTRDLEADLDRAVSLGPDHVSAYALIYEPGTPLTRDLQAGRIARTPDEVEATMFETVRAHLQAAGYPAYEVSNHARPGREARHNQAYWRGAPYLGLGAGAHSFAPGASPFPVSAAFGVRWQNERDPSRYQSAVRRQGHATREREPRTRAQAVAEFCWLGLRESRGISAAEFASRFGASFDATFPHIEELRSEGLVESREDRIVLTDRGLLLADSVFASFF